MSETDPTKPQVLRNGIPYTYANSISEMFLKKGDYKAAEEIARKTITASLKMFKQHQSKQNRKAIGLAYGTLGNVLLSCSRLDEAKIQYRKVIDLYGEIDERTEGAAVSYINLGAILEMEGDFAKALACWQEARAILIERDYSSPVKVLDQWIRELEESVK